MLKIFKREITQQALRFILIGIESTLLNYIVFLSLLFFLDVDYLIAAALGFISGVFIGYMFNKIYTFRSKRKDKIALPIYLLVYSFTLTFTLLALKIMVDTYGLSPVISNLIVLPVTTILNFIGTKILAFENLKF